jgi:hypothetical protein
LEEGEVVAGLAEAGVWSLLAGDQGAAGAAEIDPAAAGREITPGAWRWEIGKKLGASQKWEVRSEQ